MKCGKTVSLKAFMIAAMLVVSLTTCGLAASSVEMAGASLSLQSELREAVWDGPAFDFLVGLAVGAGVAAAFRGYRMLTAGRQTVA